MEDFEHNLVTQASLVARGLGDRSDRSCPGRGWLRCQLNAHLLLVDPTGRAWLSSEAILPSGDLRTQPEVAAALDRRITYETRPGTRCLAGRHDEPDLAP